MIKTRADFEDVRINNPVFEPFFKLRRRISAPVADWLNSGGFETIAIGLGALFLVAVTTTAILLAANDLFGLGIFGHGTGCTNPDPYHPCRPVATR